MAAPVQGRRGWLKLALAHEVVARVVLAVAAARLVDAVAPPPGRDRRTGPDRMDA